jgi:hypothetical protein
MAKADDTPSGLLIKADQHVPSPYVSMHVSVETSLGWCNYRTHMFSVCDSRRRRMGFQNLHHPQSVSILLFISTFPIVYVAAPSLRVLASSNLTQRVRASKDKAMVASIDCMAGFPSRCAPCADRLSTTDASILRYFSRESLDGRDLARDGRVHMSAQTKSYKMECSVQTV